MSNLLAIPFKRTYQIDIKGAAKDYISNHAGAHPDEFKNDIKLWHDLRNEGTGCVVHVDRIDTTLLYHAQLVSLLAKLPTDIQLAIPYALAFNSGGIPISLNNLIFERASVVFNLAALYSQLAMGEDRSTTDGIKRAAANYQQAAGTLSYLKSAVIPKLVFAPDDDISLDLTEGCVTGMEFLMLAQAQECSWQLAKLNQYKNSLISKISARAASLYDSAFTTLNEATPSVKRILPPDWLAHIQAKGCHFKAVAEFRKSIDEIESGNHYGVELARLGNAQVHAKQAYDVARRGRVATPVLQDTQSLLETVQKSLVRAQRDNDLIYHQDVPTPSALPAIQETNLAVSKVPPGLLNPKAVLGSQRPLFSDLVGWGTREAINIYNDRKQNLIKEKVTGAAQALQDNADEQLRKLHLPSTLEALERPVGLPPSLLRKAEEVRLENGPDRIEASLEDVETLSSRDNAILEEALDILDSEASEDEATRKEVPISRPPSHEANAELTSKAQRYREILNQARDSDEAVRQKWYEWEDHIRQLTEDEATLELAVPSTTVSATNQGTPQAKVTRQHARSLRVKLEDLDALHRDREQLVRRATALADADDIQPRVMKTAAGFERLTEVHPAMFEDVSDEELAKYDKYLREMSEFARKQEDLMQGIKTENDLFLNSRREDPAVKDRERALQDLDLAYFKYKEISRNLDEGNQFYNDLAGILVQFKEVCKAWSNQRSQELHALTRSLQALSINDDSKPVRKQTPTASPRSPGKPPGRKPPVGKSSLGLPALTSSEWEFEEIPLPPGPADRR